MKYKLIIAITIAIIVGIVANYYFGALIGLLFLGG